MAQAASLGSKVGGKWLRRQFSRAWLPWALVSSLTFGCSTAVDPGRQPSGVRPGSTQDPGLGAPGVPSQPSGEPTSGGVLPPPSPPGSPCSSDADPGRTLLRRLTHDEYDNTVRDLLGDTSGMAQAFPGVDASEASLLTLPTVLFERYEAAARTLVEEAWSREGAAQTLAAAPLLVCTPSVGDATCAQSIVRSFASRAWRRPVGDEELSHYLAVAAGPDAIVGAKTALMGLLLSPNFLYRVELDPPSGAVHALSPHELASRLSYSIWASTPDTDLYSLAQAGTLSTPSVLESTVRRMLVDPKASALVASLGKRWLGYPEVERSRPDPLIFPEARPELFGAMRKETELFLGALIAEDRSLLDLADANFTFVDDTLAQHYGLAAPVGSQFARVALPEGPRRGIIGQGSFLVSTSKPGRTSPVARGKWVAGRLLCSAPPPPPPGVDAVIEESQEAATVRERLAQHRADPSCAGCHNIIDPIGLGLEQFDGLGRFRADENGVPIDATGNLPSGAPFNGPSELATRVRGEAAFAECAAGQLVTWALGRAVGAHEACVRTEVAGALQGPEASTSAALLKLFSSRAFLNRRGE